MLHHSRLTGFPACSTIKFISCGTGILPVPKQVIDDQTLNASQPRPVSEKLPPK
ncbi:hypothetical protein [Microcoleus vaginatus]|uniref:hypothetical protein n=1 Tax=Microcoleus vaginatus TaxID=119532 RepID=UPI001F6064FD